MIVKRKWTRRLNGGLTVYRYTGYFLFGFIPLYIERGSQ